MLQRIALASALALRLNVSSCRQAPPEPPAVEPKTAEQPEMDRIAVVGHGFAFDAKRKQSPRDLKKIQAMQNSLGEIVDQARLTDDPATEKFSAGIKAAMAETKIEEERALLNAALLSKRLEGADEKMRLAYSWRNRFIAERLRGLLE